MSFEGKQTHGSNDSSLQTVPLKDFLALHTPAYYEDEEWARIPNLLSSIASEKATIDILREVIRSGQEYVEPISVDYDTKRVGNGMHRLCAAILENKSTITFSYEPSSVDAPMYEVEFLLTPVDKGEGNRRKVTEEEYDNAFDWLRSFPLGEVWVTSDSFSLSDQVCSGYWYCPSSLIGELQREIQRRARQYASLEVEILSIRELEFNEDD